MKPSTPDPNPAWKVQYEVLLDMENSATRRSMQDHDELAWLHLEDNDTDLAGPWPVHMDCIGKVLHGTMPGELIERTWRRRDCEVGSFIKESPVADLAWIPFPGGWTSGSAVVARGDTLYLWCFGDEDDRVASGRLHSHDAPILSCDGAPSGSLCASGCSVFGPAP